MATSYRSCLCCGKKYKFCSVNCHDKGLPTWHALFHDDNCHDIWYVLSDFESGKLSKEDAQEQISHLDVSVITNKEALKSLAKLMGTEFVNQSQEEETPAPEANAETPAEKPAQDPFSRPAVPISKVVEPTAEEEKPLSVSEELKKHEAHKSKSSKKK